MSSGDQPKRKTLRQERFTCRAKFAKPEPILSRRFIKRRRRDPKVAQPGRAGKVALVLSSPVGATRSRTFHVPRKVLWPGPNCLRGFIKRRRRDPKVAQPGRAGKVELEFRSPVGATPCQPK